MISLSQALWHDESGQDIAEYGLLLALIVVAAVGAVTVLGTSIADLWTSTSVEVTDALSDS